MSIFKRHRTFDEILPSFLMEKEINVKNRAYTSYVGKTKVFSLWLKNNNLSNNPLRKITNENISDFFVYLARERKLDKPTCRKYNETIQCVFKYARKRDEIENIPFDLVVFPPKGKDMSAKLIPTEDLKKLLELIQKKRIHNYF